jgi:hypothetical protein
MPKMAFAALQTFVEHPCEIFLDFEVIPKHMHVLFELHVFLSLFLKSLLG